MAVGRGRDGETAAVVGPLDRTNDKHGDNDRLVAAEKSGNRLDEMMMPPSAFEKMTLPILQDIYDTSLCIFQAEPRISNGEHTFNDTAKPILAPFERAARKLVHDISRIAWDLDKVMYGGTQGASSNMEEVVYTGESFRRSKEDYMARAGVFVPMDCLTQMRFKNAKLAKAKAKRSGYAQGICARSKTWT